MSLARTTSGPCCNCSWQCCCPPTGAGNLSCLEHTAAAHTTQRKATPTAHKTNCRVRLLPLLAASAAPVRPLSLLLAGAGGGRPLSCCCVPHPVAAAHRPNCSALMTCGSLMGVTYSTILQHIPPQSHKPHTSCRQPGLLNQRGMAHDGSQFPQLLCLSSSNASAALAHGRDREC